MTDEGFQHESRIGELVFHYLERAESDPASADTFLEELCASDPEHAAELRRRVAALVQTGLWKTPGPGEAPQVIGDFRILARLGQGGMGVVFLAEQLSVGRRVALKLVRNESLALANARARFLREAHAVARLDHPNIVRVLTAGEAGGLPYLAMEYVEGCALDALLAALQGRSPAKLGGADVRAVFSSQLGERATAVDWNDELFARGWTELCARIVCSLAEALQHAHQRGVLHRDVKPSNVLLGTDGRARLCDFGLAALADSARLTRSGAQLGTLAYMAPEQLDGDASRVGPATDVYALGLSLYEMLALRHPFVRRGEAATRLAILDGSPPPLRTLNPSVPADLEIVCAKALERDPARRYTSSGEFARDLGNVLALRPIEARRPTLTRRAVRWAQRRPAAAVGVALGGLLLVAGPVGWELSRMRSLEQVREAYERSEQDFRSALAAIGHVLRDTATEELEDVPRMQQARLVALDRALALFGALAEARADQPEVLVEGAQLHRSRAEILADLGHMPEATAEYDLAVQFQRRALAAEPSAERERALAAALVSHGKSFSALARTAEGLASLEDGVALWRKAPDDELDRGLTKALIVQAESYELLGRHDDARAAAEEALERARRASEREPGDPEHPWCIGRASGWLAVIAERADDREARAQRSNESLGAFERAAQLAPGVRFYAYEIADAEVQAAGAALSTGAFEEGERLLRNALARLDVLLRDFPDSRRYRSMRSQALEQLAVHFTHRGRFDEALELQADIVVERERELAAQPGRCDVAMLAALANLNLGAGLLGTRRELERAAALHARAEELVRPCEISLEGDAEVDRMVCGARYGEALALVQADLLGRARDAIERHAATVGSHADRMRYAADLWNEYALALRRTQPADLAASEAEAVERMFALLRSAVTSGYRDLDELRSTPALEPFRSDPRFAAVLALAGG